MITEDYVSVDVAKLLKEKGMDKSYFKHYVQKNNNDGTSEAVIVCTHQAAMKWLREKHNICISIYPDKGNRYEAVLYNIKDDVEIILQSFGIYGSHIFEDSYEEAVEAALKYCLENLI